MLMTQLGEHLANRIVPAFGIVRRQGFLGELPAPKLTGDNVHVALDALKVRLGFLQDLLGA